MTKLDLLAFAAHPDDVELACAGTIAIHTAMGKKVGIVDLTRGELGTRGTPELREEEAQKASEILKIHYRANLGFADGFFSIDKDHLLPVIQQIRACQPQVILANAIEDRHIDHPKGAKLVHEAAFLAGLAKIETYDTEGNLQAPWRPAQMYHYIQDRWIQPHLLIEVNHVWQQRMDAVKAFKSQFYDPESDQPETPISSKDFWEFLEARARNFGRLINVSLAEGFTKATPIGVTNLFETTLL
ncbi:MAG: bacillithiol biosynthesis deacetylase BshB1 [Cytophagales bacterium]|nr:MAG: bacillithiol biosynthesis deacetylase BshB1 [Cytophagales bacterium]